MLWALIGLAVVALAIRRRWRLAIYLLVTAAGELTLDPVLKALVGRLRPAAMDQAAGTFTAYTASGQTRPSAGRHS